jgi:hypothetical protein
VSGFEPEGRKFESCRAYQAQFTDERRPGLVDFLFDSKFLVCLIGSNLVAAMRVHKAGSLLTCGNLYCIIVHMNRLGVESQRRAKHGLMATAIAGIATGAVLHGPSPSTSADLLHQAFGKENVAERAVEQMADNIYRRTVFVHCAPTEGAHGEASTLYRTIRLNPSTCRVLEGIVSNPEVVNPEDEQVVSAVYATAHEFSHVDGADLNGEHDEGITSCVGAQRSQEVAEGLGIPSDKAHIIGERAAIYANAAPRADYAIPDGCKDNGSYDINARGNHFPVDPIDSFLKGD